ncbi:hypothetical protein [Saccharothrix deserti]|uniref:hypothetical protein n=1 Tax=Saccharothrix deserti TaxID=2593674 RepID=UPI00131B1611|nr:hypothetical protein [Saccharothrix deserti]
MGGLLIALPGPPDEPAPAGPSADGLGARLDEFAAALRDDVPYVPPDERQRRAFVEAVTALGSGSSEASGATEALGLTVERGTDAHTGRPYVAVASAPDAKRGWGFYVIDASRPARVVVQVPHPANDLRTDEIGVELFRRVPGAVLAVAGTHRRVAGGAGDAAHRTDSGFHALAEEHARRGLPQVQLHGFEDDSLPSADVVLSPGSGEAGALVERVAAGLEGELRVCRAWERDCGELEGRRNKQGEAAARHGTVFVHVEVNRTVREDPAAWREVVRVIGDALGDGD